jgi:hypothetical protein
MDLTQLLQRHKRTILDQWFDLLLESYPSDTAVFIKSQKDPFHNPVGDAAHRGMEALFGGIIEGMDSDTATSFLDPIIRIRAIQKFTPAQAVLFVFQLKSVLQKQFRKELTDPDVNGQFQQIMDRIDDLGLLAFNIYVQCRETLYQIQADEIRNRTFKVLKRSGLLQECDDSDEPPPS